MRISAVILFLLISFPAFSANSANSNVMNIESITILASSSLTIPITEISKQYSREHNTDINTVYDASGELLLDIEDGDPADVIIISSKKHLDELKAEGLLDPKSIIEIAENRLSLVSSKDMFIEKEEYVEETLMNIHNKALMIIADPSTTSLGNETVEFLKKIKLWPIFEKRVVLAPTSTKVVDYIIKGQSAGVIYASDAKLYEGEIVHLADVPDSLNPPTKYYAAVVVSGNMDKARNYLKYLKTKTAKNILKRDGFVVK